MIRRLLSAVAFVFVAAVAHAQSVPIFASLTISPRAEESARDYGGLSLDFANSRFVYSPSAGGAATVYTSASDLVTALGGTISLGAKNCYNASGLLITTTANTPTLCYDSTGGNPGLWIEGGRTNSLLWTEDFSNAVWTKTNVSATPNSGRDPRGGTAAILLKEDGSTGNHFALQSVTKSATAQNRVLSTWAAPGVGARCLALYVDDGTTSNGAFVIIDMLDLPDSGGTITPVVGPTTFGTGFSATQAFALSAMAGPTRFALAYTTNTTTTIRAGIGLSDCSGLSYAGDGLSSILVWGPQSEQFSAGANEMATYPTSYMASTGTNGSRAYDQFVVNVPGAWGTPTNWAIYTNVIQPASLTPASTYWMTIDDNTSATNKIPVYKSNTGTQSIQVYSGGSAIMARGIARSPLGVRGRLACSLGTAGYVCFDNYDQTVSNGTPISIPSGLTKLHVGQSSTSALFPADGRISHVGIFPAALPNARLKAMVKDTVDAPNDIANPPHALGPNSINSVSPAVGSSFFVSQQAGPPATDAVGDPGCTATTRGCWQTTFPFFPMSLSETQNIKQLVASTWTGGTSTTSCNPACPISGEHFVWGNHIPRTVVAEVPNPTFPTFTSSSGLQCRMIYTTMDRSDAATAAQIAFSAGWGATEAGPNAGKGYLDITRAAGIPDANVMSIDSFIALARNPATDPCTGTATSYVGTFSTATDYILLPQARMVDATIPMRGIRLDAEWFDGRTGSRVINLISQIMGLIAPAKNGTTYKLSLLNDDLTGAPAQYNGLNGTTVCDALNLGAEMSVTAKSKSSQNDIMLNLQAQMDYVTTACGGSFPYSKFRIIYQLGNYPSGTTLADATNVHALIAAHPWTGVTIQRVYSQPGGDCSRYTIQRIETLLGMPFC